MDIEENQLPPLSSETITPQALTGWENPPSLRALKQDLSDARQSHDQHVSKVRRWLDNMHIEGTAVPKVPEGNSRVAPKLIRKQAEWRYPALTAAFLSKPDIFAVHPMTWADKKAAVQNQLVLNWQFNTHIDKTRFIDDFVRTVVDEGTVFVRVAWDFEEEDYTEDEEQFTYVADETFAPTIQQLGQMKQQDPNGFAQQCPPELVTALDLSASNGFAVKPIPNGVQEVTKTRTIKNRPLLEVYDYRNVILDPLAKGDVDKATFVIFTFTSSLSVLRKDSRYKNLDRIMIDNESPLQSPDHNTPDNATQNFNHHDRDRKKFVVYEYWGFWDVHKTGVMTPFVASWVGDVLVRMEESPYPDKKLPLVCAQYLPVRHSNFGEPDGELLEDNQKIIGAVTRGMIDIMGKSANGQTGTRKDFLDVTNKRKFDRGQDYEFNPTVDPRTGVFMHTYPEIPASAQFMLQMQNMEAESISGVKAFSDGISGKTMGDVAAGVRGVLDATSKREANILERLKNAMRQIGRKIIAMNQEFLSEEEVIRITDEEFVRVKRDDLSGAFDLRLDIATPEEDENRARELSFMLQTMGNTVDPAMARLVLAEIARLRRMPDLAKKIETFQPQPDPIAEQMKQLSMEKLKAEIGLIQAQTMAAQAGAQLSGSKVGTEQAKARDINSGADLKNLDFVETESGVKQERALQHVGEQARSQAQLKQLDMQMQERQMQADLVKEYIRNRNKAA